jgi:hypothetical protein
MAITGQKKNYIPSNGATFVPGRRKYCRDKVQKMRAELVSRKSNREGISDSEYQRFLGKLQAAGHLKINGFKRINIDKTNMEPVPFIPNDEGGMVDSYSIGFDSIMNKNMKGNRPHITGYLTSVHEKDKEYKLKGWFNEDGTIRLLIVN